MYDVPLSVIATRCHLSQRRGSLFFLKSYLLTQPFRLLARLAATFPFREDMIVLRNFNFSYYYELLYAPCKGAGIAVGDD